jgi:hypothetical protein
MFNGHFLLTMYQQWCDGQSDATSRWRSFVELAAKHNHTTTERMLEELQKYRWFQKTDE